MTDPLDLDRRAGWPAELRALLERHPRERWPAPEALGEMAAFWLRRHDFFRSLGAALERGVGRFREGRIDAEAFRDWFAPRLRLMLGELELHHRIEDAHYFPAFRAAEARLARGFEVLERDHETIHGDLIASAEAGRALLAAGDDPDRAARAVEAWADVNARLIARLARHLEDEEDLIVPIVLERGEPPLGA